MLVNILIWLLQQRTKITAAYVGLNLFSHSPNSGWKDPQPIQRLHVVRDTGGFFGLVGLSSIEGCFIPMVQEDTLISAFKKEKGPHCFHSNPRGHNMATILYKRV